MISLFFLMQTCVSVGGKIQTIISLKYWFSKTFLYKIIMIIPSLRFFNPIPLEG